MRRFERLRYERVDVLFLDVEGYEDSVLRGINFTRTPIDNIVCESSCAEVLSAHGYKTMKLPHWAGPDALWRREPLPPERDDGGKLDLVNAHIASSRHGLAPGAGLRGLLSG